MIIFVGEAPMTIKVHKRLWTWWWQSYNKINNLANGVLLRMTWSETLIMFFKKCNLMSVGDCLYMQHLSMVDWIKWFKSDICKFTFCIY
jgi:hypothetical protein